MALIQTEDHGLIDTRNIIILSITPVNPVTGMSDLHAHIGTIGENIFTCPKAQAEEISNEIAQKWYTEEILTLPLPRPLTIDEETELWKSLHTNEKKNIHVFQTQEEFIAVRRGTDIQYIGTLWGSDEERAEKRSKLQKALEQVPAIGNPSIRESLLNSIFGEYPRVTDDEE